MPPLLSFFCEFEANNQAIRINETCMIFYVNAAAACFVQEIVTIRK